MQTFSINFAVPSKWSELSDKQLRYVYQLIADGNDAAALQTLCLLQWGGAKVVGRQDNDAYLLRKGNFLFEVTPTTIAEVLALDTWRALTELNAQTKEYKQLKQQTAK